MISELSDIYGCPELSGPNLLSSRLDLIKACLDEYKQLSDLFDRPPRKYWPAEGVRTSDLWREHDVLSSDLFLAARPSGPESRAVSYADLSDCLFDDIRAAFGIGTMAFEEKEKYAKADHGHAGEYSKASYVSSMGGETRVAALLVGPDGEEYPPESHLNAMSVLYETPLPVYPPRPEVGTLKFVYLSENAVIRTNQEMVEDDEFDGWLWPDGSTVHLRLTADFEKAIRVYGNGSADSITLPDLAGCFKLSGGPVADVEEVFPQRLSPVPQHQHDIAEATIQSTAQAQSGGVPNFAEPSGKGALSSMHCGVPSKPWTLTGELNVANLNIPKIKLDPYSETRGDGKFRPRRYNIPVMVYVGGEYAAAMAKERYVRFKLKNGHYPYPTVRTYCISAYSLYLVGENSAQRAQSIEYPALPKYAGYVGEWQDTSFMGMSEAEAVTKVKQDVTVYGKYTIDPNNPPGVGWDGPIEDGPTGFEIPPEEVTLLMVDDPTTQDVVECLGRTVPTGDGDLDAIRI